MKIKPIVQIQSRSQLKIFRTVYLVIYLIVIAGLGGVVLFGSGRGDGSTSGLELATLIASFVLGLLSFREAFLFYTGVGVSRKGIFWGILASFGVMNVATALIDCINIVIFSHIMNYNSLYYSLTQIAQSGFYRTIESDLPSTAPALTASFLLKNFLWCILAYFCMATFGFFLTVLYYRMKKTLKVAVSAGVPILVFYLLPLLDEEFFGGALGAAVIAFGERWIACAANPLWDVISSLCLAAVFAGLTFLLMRRAGVKRS